ncbi:TIGR01777 family oxidoreductase [Sporosarcina sp. GW1-11]|uniref:TIGR01777 family oxidoreductase n=1 Tax=Sporosarcina sp. GW1-11 TaxID=2899126 RepID=UPI00294C1E6B|nr:TIGR01777 family oxidoreductase [Sporosarcina sp. GW1-11]MDV6379297.1 TIGR01777 family oxidoreductase [Sporosarcina sp. GW1-11]
MRVVITGGTGFIGSILTKTLQKQGHDVIIFTRKPSSKHNGVQYVQWLTDHAAPENEIGEIDAIVNLAGVSIDDGRWTEERKKQIHESRITATTEILRIIKSLPKKPSVLVNASAIGIYPPSLTAKYTEESKAVGNDFLAQTVYDWEHLAQTASDFDVRTVFTRFGIVLGKDGGALPLIQLPYKLFAGGKIGSGNQWFSWVHVEDVANAILFSLENDSIEGPVNVVAPSPMHMNAFGKTIAKVLHRPHWFPVPSFAMELALGEKSIIVLKGQHVFPKKLLENGFTFSYPSLESALKNLL